MNSTSSNHSYFTDELIVVPICQMLLAFSGILLNLLALTALIIVYQSTKNTFYIAIISLGLVDVLYLAETLFYSLPCSLAQQIFLGSTVDRIIGHVDTITWFGQCAHVFFIAFNRLRFTCNVNLETFDAVFSRKKTMFWLAGLWLFSLAMTLMSEIGHCVKSFQLDGSYWTFTCTVRSPVLMINSIISGLLPIISGVFYFAMWLIIKWRRAMIISVLGSSSEGRKKRLRQELSMISQFAIVTGLLIANYVSFWVFPNLLSPRASTIVIQMIAIFNASINPCIYLIFNETLSKRMVKLAKCQGIRAAQDGTLLPLPSRMVIDATKMGRKVDVLSKHSGKL